MYINTLICTCMYCRCRADFTIMLNDGENSSVFFLLELACVTMCKISAMKNQKKTSSELHDHFIYNTMVWGTYILCDTHVYLW